MRSRAIRSLCYVLVLALVSTLAPTPLVAPASAQLMPTYAVGVADFINESGVQGELLSRLATDAVVVEMSKTNRYDVSITRSMMKSKMEELGLRAPLTKLDLVRLGEALSADAMLEGSVKSIQLAGSGPTRRASVTLICQMVDQASGEIINGAVQTGQSSARVGYTADDNSLIAEAINAAAFLCVKTMIDYVIPEATVLMNIGDSQIMINKGARDGIKPGMRMIVLRDKEIIGYIDVTSTSPMDAMTKVIKSMRGIQPQDKARAIFEMPMVSASLKSAPLPSGAPSKGRVSGGSGSKIAKFLLGALIVGGVAAMFTGGRGVAGSPGLSVKEINNSGQTRAGLGWSGKLYNYGNNLEELQIFQDTIAAGATTAPFVVVTNKSIFAQGKLDLTPLFGGAAPRTVNYDEIVLGSDSPVAATFQWPAEAYGKQHVYQARAIVKTATGTGQNGTTTYSYDTTNFGNSIRLTAVEPVANNPAHIVSPSANEPVLVTDLRDGAINLSWISSAGANEYMVTAEPVQSGIGPVWHSSIISHYTGETSDGATLSISDADRLALAAILSSPNFVDKDIRWRVDARNSTDSQPLCWTTGGWNVFHIAPTPEGPPSP